jgi:hypothetical protein
MLNERIGTIIDRLLQIKQEQNILKEGKIYIQKCIEHSKINNSRSFGELLQVIKVIKEIKLYIRKVESLILRETILDRTNLEKIVIELRHFLVSVETVLHIQNYRTHGSLYTYELEFALLSDNIKE